jgi:general secretion pathway protein M
LNATATRATPGPGAAWKAPLLARWRALSDRDRLAAGIALAAIALLLLWWVAVQPALRTVRAAPVQIDRLDAQLQVMQRQAAEAAELRGTAPLTAAQSTAALQAATARLGQRGRLVVAGERATLTLNGATGAQLRDWLSEARSGARARPLQVQLNRSPQGYSGTVIVAVGGTT